MTTTRSTAILLDDRAKALAAYPHARRVGDWVFVSGISSRRPDNTHEGVEVLPDGTVVKDIRAQTRAVLQNIGVILRAAGSDLGEVVDLTVFLVDMRDYAGMNEVYNTFFEASSGPTRTTVAVHQLPHPNLLVEIKAVAFSPPRLGSITQEGMALGGDEDGPDSIDTVELRAVSRPARASDTQEGPWLREDAADPSPRWSQEQGVEVLRSEPTKRIDPNQTQQGPWLRDDGAADE